MLGKDSTPSTVSFGAFEVDLRAGEVRKLGYKIRLQDQPFRVLEVLLERHGEVVTREELQRRIWAADTFVDFDRGLNNAIKRLREALGDSAEHPQFVETLARRGYRFIAPTNGVKGNGHQEAVVGQTAPALATERHYPSSWTRRAIAAAIALALALAAILYWRPMSQNVAPHSLLRPTRVVASPAENPVNFAAISPDGRQVAYADATGVHVKLVETGEVRTILPPSTDAPGSPNSGFAVRFPVAWYPDGSRLLVTTGAPRSTTPQPAIWSISLVTNNSQKLFEGAWGSSVSPDGSLVAAIKNESEIWLMGPHGEDPRQFAVAEAGTEIGRTIWSPDGQWLADFRVFRRPDALECGLETRRLRDPRPRILLSDPRLCSSQAQSSWWLPDNRVIFAFSEPSLDNHDFNLWEIRVDPRSGKAASQQARLTDWTGFCLQGVTASVDGKRVAFLRDWFQTNIAIGDIDSTRLGTFARPHRLANEVDGDWPTAWTKDSRAIVFYSSKSGDNDVYTQSLAGDSAEPVVAGPGEQLAAVLSPDGLWLVYMEVPNFEHFGAATRVKLMKIPVSGGTPQLVLTSETYDSHQCTRDPSGFCVLGERSADGRHLILTTFDPSKNSGADVRGRVLLNLDTDPARDYQWAISPHGSHVAISQVDDSEIRIRTISLRGAPDTQIEVKRWPHLISMHWAMDERSFFISSRSGSRCTVLQVDMLGNAHVLFQQPGAYQTWALPSPDGRHLAIFSAAMSSEVWTAENF